MAIQTRDTGPAIPGLTQVPETAATKSNVGEESTEKTASYTDDGETLAEAEEREAKMPKGLQLYLIMLGLMLTVFITSLGKVSS